MNIIVIGAGFGGLSAAAYLANAGHTVTVYEKNAGPGGRASATLETGFRFEPAPGWYFMPDVFEEFFADFGHTPEDFYHLQQLVPSYRVYNQGYEFTAHPYRAALMDFEQREEGAGEQLSKLLKEAKKEYIVARRDFWTLSGLSRKEYAKPSILRMLTNRKLLGSYHNRMSKVVDDRTLRHVLEFMTLFLGGSPYNMPAAYGFLAHVDFGLGIWYPRGGFAAVADAVETVAKNQGAKIIYNTPVDEIIVKNGTVSGVKVGGEFQKTDVVVANADYHFVDSRLVPAEYRTYSEEEWEAQTLSFSCVVATVGVKKRLNLEHHTLFFDTGWRENLEDLFDNHLVNPRPLFFVSAPSKSDPEAAPKGHENISIFIPVSSRANVTRAQAETLVRHALGRIEVQTGDRFRSDIVTQRVYTPEYFRQKFHAFHGNAFGLAHTGGQSGPLRPPIRSSKLLNLYFAGHYTNPGASVPLVLLSGKLVAKTLES